jgi:ATP-binding cassette, subfamily C, bacteriocin exporter
MKRNIYVRQQDITDCGAACLASVGAYHGVVLPVARIRQMANTDKQGTTMLGLMEAAEKMGFSAKGVKGNFQSLFEIPLPAIVHTVNEENLHHYKVLYAAGPKFLKFMDPSDGKMHHVTHEEFKKEWSGVLLLMARSAAWHPEKQGGSVTSRFFQLLTPHRMILVQSLFGALFYALLGLSTSVYVQKIVDHVLVDGNLNLLNLMSMIMLIFLVTKITLNWLKGLFCLKTGQMLDATLISGYYKHIMLLPKRFFDTMRIGEILSRISDAVKIRALINNASLDIAVNLMIVVFTSAMMFLFSWRLAVVVILIIPFFMIIWIVFNRVNKKILRKIMEHSADLESQLVESLENISTIKQFSAVVQMNEKTDSKFYRLLKSVYVSSKSMLAVQGFCELVSGLMTVAVLWIGSSMVVNTILSPGTLLSFYAMLGYLISPVTYLINVNHVLQDAMIAADRLFQIMDLECEQPVDGKVQLTSEMIGDLYFKHVSFGYNCRAHVFEDLNMTIHKGEITAIVGESGSGKTSVIAMLEKLYPIQSGSIEIGEYNLHEIEIDSLRQKIGIVPQKVELLSSTIAENIALGNPEPDLRRIIDICGLLNMREFIEKIPGSYHAVLGERGHSLSGGEQQRLAIARALYPDPEIVIFDEATSALDSLAEANIRQVIRNLKNRGKTIIVITHRFRSIMNADRIYVMHKGRVMEEGNHASLMAERGYYFSLWKQQFPMLEQVLD